MTKQTTQEEKIKEREDIANMLKERLLNQICISNDIDKESELAGDINYALTMMRNELLDCKESFTAGQEAKAAEVSEMIEKEITVAHMEGTTTARLTSLYNKLSALTPVEDTEQIMKLEQFEESESERKGKKLDILAIKLIALGLFICFIIAIIDCILSFH